MKNMDIKCPHCSRTITAADINVQTSIAKCGYCNAVFGFADKVPGAAAGSSKRTVEMPKNYTMGNEGVDLVITRRWLSKKYVVMLVFCVFWDGFLVFWYTVALTKAGPLIMILFPVLHVAVGGFLTYFTLAGFLNRTKITVNTGQLRIKHYPLPWPGNKVIQRQELEQLFCEETMHSSKNSTSYTYSLQAVTVGGGRMKLISGMDKPEDALFLEQKIEGFLGITDRSVTGEMRPV